MEENQIKSGPRCPKCEIEGIEYISSEQSTEQSKAGDAWFNVAYCNHCGYIHGIFNKIANPPSMAPIKLPKF